MYYTMVPVAYAYPPGNPNGMQHPYNLNHPEGLPRNKSKKDNTNPTQKAGHTHAHYGATTCNDKHTHLHPGVTSTPIETSDGHVHKIYGNTTFDYGHIHYYEAQTSPPIPLGNGYHTHYAEIKTTENDGHTHTIKGYTRASKS
ncbi:YmaF family protein [Virgibacillus sp. L01]|uniref:YmaF family protein n=1 Tax=Virgibacillus sp. L01 TaxID=3457429 RepID=UPI003FD19630